MKKVILTVIFYLFSSIALASEQPSMFGLNGVKWGDSEQTVNAKMLEINMILMPKDNYSTNMDRITGSDSRGYFGKTLGYRAYLFASFKNNKLIRLSAHFDKNTPLNFFRDLEGALKEKYGKPEFSSDRDKDGYDDTIEWELENINTDISLSTSYIEPKTIMLSYSDLEHLIEERAKNRKKEMEETQRKRQELKNKL
jgi:hypothetical protein